MENWPQNSIPAEDMDRLITAHDGDMALLYIYLRRRGSDLDKAACDLCRTGADIASAAEKLRRMGLLTEKTAAERPIPQKPECPVPPPDELPEYTADDIVRRSREDGKFSLVVSEAQRILGRGLSGADMKILFGIYDYLAMPPEVILELINFCVDRCGEKYGPGRMPSMRTVEKQAYIWANDEILTIDQAEEYIHDFRKRHKTLIRAAEAMGIRGRALTATEQKYITDWLNMGFDPAALEIAYDRTVTNTGSMKWPYMNKIIMSWNSKGLHTPEEILEKDAPARRAAPAPAVSRADSLKALKNKIKSN